MCENIPKLLIAGQSSGVGKTTITLGLIAALRRRGLIIQPFKCGPDYIDPTYHSLAAERTCRNLDTWMLTPAQMLNVFHRACQGADVAIIEGVMGLFDGDSYRKESGSSAHIAKVLDAPVVLVLNIGKLARSVGALALGYHLFDPSLKLVGFLLNNAGSEKHADGCIEAIGDTTDLPTFGWLSKQSNVYLPERHLGLIPTIESALPSSFIDGMAEVVESQVDLDKLLSTIQHGVKKNQHPTAHTQQWQAPVRQSTVKRPMIAVARDEAFSFYYPDNLELLREAGAEICFFSPLHDRALPSGISGLYLGGGFPELYAEPLSQNHSLHTALRDFHAEHKPIYAECGGFMLLTEALVDQAGVQWPMIGLVPGIIQMQKRLAALGYRVATALHDNILLRAGASVRGHEFHYSTWQIDTNDIAASIAWSLRRRVESGEYQSDGYVEKNLLASYLHIHFGQDSTLAANFVAHCTV